MRLIEVAKKLGMTGQELRRELSQVDFGIKPTDREVPDQLAQGIIRFLARKHNITIEEEENTEQKIIEEEVTVEQEDKEEEKKKSEPAPLAAQKRTEAPSKKLHVLRKLSLEDVSDAAVRAQTAVHSPAAAKAGTAARTAVRKKVEKKKSLAVQEQIKKKEGMVELPEEITVKEFAEKTGVQVPEVIATLMKSGVMANINQTIDYETAAIVASELDVQVKKIETGASAEGLLSGNLAALLTEDDDSVFTPRPPIVTVMGHVDHGKTAILDAIRKTDVVAGEAGGITQGIGAYQVEHSGKKITFLDTPGHEAFTAMRARGAQITDIVVLVVAADEGVKPTTIEAIAHAKEAGVPILVAINKADKEGADADRVKGELAQHDLQAEEWGGKTPVVLCSAKTGLGINDLLDNILILAEIAELKANADRFAVATVIESHLDPSLGPVASLVVNAGTLRIGDIIVCGTTSGKVKSMDDARGSQLEVISPSGAVRVAGLSEVPETGDILQVVKDEQEARKLHMDMVQAAELRKKRGIGDLMSRLSEGKLTALKIVLKADSQGSLEAIENALKNIKTDQKVVPKIIHSAVGGITESDVMMAAASDGIVVGFTVTVSTHVERISINQGVKVLLYDIIYELLDEVTGLLAGLVEPEEQEVITGHVEVKGVFFRKKAEQVIGGVVTDGIIKRVSFRVLRGGEEVGTGRITSVRRVDKDIKEAKEGSECGLRIDSSVMIEEGDVIETYVREFKKKAL